MILKTDVNGTLEAIVDVLATYQSERCKLDLVNFGVGSVTQSDIELAETFNAIIYAFNVELLPSLKNDMDNIKVIIKSHNVIYKLIDDIKEELNRRLPSLVVEEVLGEAKVLQQFEITVGRKKVPVAGCRCLRGILKRMSEYKVIRNGEVIYTGMINIKKGCFVVVIILKSEYRSIKKLFSVHKWKYFKIVFGML